MILVLDSCGTKQQIPTSEEITEIIIETIKQDSLDINIPVCLNLVNRYIYEPQYDKDLGYFPPPPRNKNGEPFVFSMHKLTKGDSLGFHQTDSVFISKQIISNKDICLDLESIPKNIKIKNVPVLKNNEEGLYKFLIPLFNSNKDFVIVEYDYQSVCCGYGVMIFFKKIDGKWIKIDSFGTWTS